MRKMLKEKWEQLWLSLHARWTGRREKSAPSEPEPALPLQRPTVISIHAEKSVAADITPLVPGSGQYRSTPDPAFGSRSAAQRQAYERLQQMREAEASRNAAEHSRERQEHKGPHSQAS